MKLKPGDKVTLAPQMYPHGTNTGGINKEMLTRLSQLEYLTVRSTTKMKEDRQVITIIEDQGRWNYSRNWLIPYEEEEEEASISGRRRIIL
jgi:hypothetical protein